MRIEHDKEHDTAYLYIVDQIADGEAVRQVMVENAELSGDVVLDFDENGFLLGVEILGASSLLRSDLLDEEG